MSVAYLKCVTGYANDVVQLAIKITDYTFQQKQKLVAIMTQPMKVRVSLIGTISPLCPFLFRFFSSFFSHILSSLFLPSPPKTIQLFFFTLTVRKCPCFIKNI